MQQRVVVIEGIAGNLGINLLTPEIVKLAQRFKDNPHVKFYGTELNTDKITAKGKESLKTLTALGMIIINKSDAAGMKLYTSLQPDYVFLATPAHTHIKLAQEWLKRAHPPKAVLVEKPFSENLKETRKFVEFLNQNPHLKSKIYAYDFADDNFALWGESLKQIQSYLGPISEMIFFWMQDHSGADKGSYTYLLAGDDRPITRENRIAQLPEEKRMVFDAFPHFFNPIEDLTDLRDATITDVKAAQYQTAEIKGETFVAARVLLNSRLTPTEPIVATMYAGKGVGGVETLDMNRLAHMLILRNKVGKEIRLSIDDATAYFVKSNGQVEKRIPLVKLYARTMENLFFGNAEFGRTPQYALQCLEVLDKIRDKINTQLKQTNLDTYRLGTSKVSAPSLEKILQTTRRVYGTREDMLCGQELKVLVPQSRLRTTQMELK
ncbi:MAG: Gfo/Idh/MocA family oxidoreductase [Proteobacteria bacterium]|nr:Gfo/Idh/MocA family oxidoreductase [Pseudomonadota bacterium]